MGNLLGIVIAAIVNALLGRFFPGHPKVTPEAVAQANKDRADALQAQKNARQEADNLRDAGERTRRDDPGGVFAHDANERRDDKPDA